MQRTSFDVNSIAAPETFTDEETVENGRDEESCQLELIL